MIIKGVVSVELDYDKRDEFLRNALMDDYGSLAKGIDKLMSQTDLKRHEKEDLEYDLNLMSAIDTVLSNYLTYTEHQNFRHAWKRFVDMYQGSYS